MPFSLDKSYVFLKMLVLLKFLLISGVILTSFYGCSNDEQDITSSIQFDKNNSSKTEDQTLVIGGYANGCMHHAQPLQDKGIKLQVMRPSRNRIWGDASLLEYLNHLADDIHHNHPWPGILVGDLSQKKGGRMKSSHKSHQNGLDVDIWLDPAPNYILSQKEREHKSATSHVRRNMTIRPSWTDAHRDFILRTADAKNVERIFINAALKKDLCSYSKNTALLHKIRPWYGHDDHIHVRLKCPEGAVDCTPQASVPAGSGCDALQWWFSKDASTPKSSGKKQKKKDPVKHPKCL